MILFSRPSSRTHSHMSWMDGMGRQGPIPSTPPCLVRRYGSLTAPSFHCIHVTGQRGLPGTAASSFRGCHHSRSVPSPTNYRRWSSFIWLSTHPSHPCACIHSAMRRFKSSNQSHLSSGLFHYYILSRSPTAALGPHFSGERAANYKLKRALPRCCFIRVLNHHIIHCTTSQI